MNIPTASLNIGRVDVEILPGHPATHAFTWDADLDLPTDPVVHIGADPAPTVIATVTTGRTISFTVDATQTPTLVAQPWLMIDTGGTPILGGQTTRWAGRTGPVGSDITVGVDPTGAATIIRSHPIPGPPGPPSPAGVGTLAARPDAGTVEDGSLYHATDDNGGTLSVVTGGEWVPAAPSVADLGGLILASCWPTAIAPAAAASGGLAVFPELTTSAFTAPNRPTRVRLNRALVLVTAGGAPADATNWAIESKVGGGPWTNVAYSPSLDQAVTKLRFETDLALLTLPPGDSVQVRLAVHNTSAGARTFQPQVNLLFRRFCGFDVVSG